RGTAAAPISPSSSSPPWWCCSAVRACSSRCRSGCSPERRRRRRSPSSRCSPSSVRACGPIATDRAARAALLGLLIRIAVAAGRLHPARLLLARPIGPRLRWPVVGCSVLAAVLLLAPWLSGRSLLVPDNFLGSVIPGLKARPPEIHDELNDAVYQF